MLRKLKSRLTDLTKDPKTAIATGIAVTLAGFATREAVVVGYRLVKGEEPPRDPSRPDVDWRTALGWSTALGVSVGLVRLVTRRVLHPGRFSV